VGYFEKMPARLEISRIISAMGGGMTGKAPLPAQAFQSAMSMLNFYINRAGSTLPARQREFS
jgi:hypothetical protein